MSAKAPRQRKNVHLSAGGSCLQQGLTQSNGYSLVTKKHPQPAEAGVLGIVARLRLPPYRFRFQPAFAQEHAHAGIAAQPHVGQLRFMLA